MSSAATIPADHSAEVTQGVNPWLIAASVMLATFMEVLDTAIASVALPYIAGSLSASNDEATWVLTSYLVANAIVLPASNWFSLRFGRKRFLVICVMIFTAASFACGAAPTLGMILLARIVQGAGGGALQPLSQAILFESFPPAKRGAAAAVFAFGVVVAPVLGPTLGGWLTDTYSWRYAFYINIPVGILAVFMISRFVHDPPYIKNAKVPAFDNMGFGALVVWTGLLQVILDKGQEDDWFGATWIRVAFPIMLAAFLWWVWISWHRKNPLVDLKVLKNRNFAIGCLLIFLFGIAIYSTVTVLPLFYQELLGYTAFTAGVVVAPRGLGAICGMPVIGYLSNKVDPRYLLTFGFIVFGLTTLYFGSITLQVSPTTLLVPILITGFGLSFVFVPITTAAYGTLPNEQMGNASGLFNLMRNVGGSIGISIAQTLLIRRAAVHQNLIVNSVPRTGAQFQNSLQNTTGFLARYYGPANAADPAQATLYRELLRQASSWAFVDVFRWLSLLSFGCVVAVWLLKKVKPGKGPIGAH
ncbi:DHA2 family efflux MFS transporter permease subunit [Edaphobacter sp. 12200R-103]|uniref:DHA2 family efflux MFS transporter permease subunit n=1 Tax=Edaphobacter sp. 12200R-103 TaxID=2703788 RepID=UPI00138BF3AF|nr:DHA2 family efflux MFS transporter permease subunit [Edaphobacter sp. 12200R-103]QHS53545.1 DHA2 family efflux MFS transporter permease subunit [Edaphobacter sp. 12200R-103]